VTIWEALRQAETAMSPRGIPDARVESEILLMHALGWDRAGLYARLKEPLPDSEREAFWDLVEQRLQRRPTPYITQQCQFYGVDLYIDERALIPRPETEGLVDTVLQFAEHRSPAQSTLVADVGTGSGAIAVALALHLPQAHIYAIDISPDSLEVARINVRRHRLEQRVDVLAGDMLQAISEAVDIMAANLPYVRDADWSGLMPEIRDHEPQSALLGGPDGLDKIRLFLPQAVKKLRPQGLLLLEIGQGQGPAVLDLARHHFPSAEADLIPDLAGMDRTLRVLMRSGSGT